MSTDRVSSNLVSSLLATSTWRRIMPIWTREPSAEERTPNVPIIRTPAKGALVGFCTSYHLIGCNLHWWKNRSLPCEGKNCPACAGKTPWRWKGYIGLWQPEIVTHSILEFPAGCCDPITNFCEHDETIRGAIVKLTRVPQKQNGRVVLQIKRPKEPQMPFPDALDITVNLGRIWDMPAHQDAIMPERAKARRVTTESNGRLQTDFLPTQ